MLEGLNYQNDKVTKEVEEKSKDVRVFNVTNHTFTPKKHVGFKFLPKAQIRRFIF